MNLKFVKHLQLFSSVPSFYQAVVISWFLIGGGNVKTPLNFRDVREQFICGNNCITLNNKPIFNSNLSNAGIRYVNDLLDHQNILSKRFLRSKINRKSDWIFKIEKIEKHDESVKTLYTFLMRNKSARSHVEKAWTDDFGIIYSYTQWNHI